MFAMYCLLIRKNLSGANAISKSAMLIAKEYEVPSCMKAKT